MVFVLGEIKPWNKIVTLQKRALRLIYFCKSKEHTVLFFLKSKCLPLPSLFFRDCGYLLYDINRQTAPVYLVYSNYQFVETSQIHNFRTRSVSRDSFYVKFSRTDKMYAFFLRIAAKIWNSIPYSINLSKHLSLRKKMREFILFVVKKNLYLFKCFVWVANMTSLTPNKLCIPYFV